MQEIQSTTPYFIVPDWVLECDRTKPVASDIQQLSRQKALEIDFNYLLQAAPDTDAVRWVLRGHPYSQFHPAMPPDLQLWVESCQLTGIIETLQEIARTTTDAAVRTRCAGAIAHLISPPIHPAADGV